MVTVPFAFKVAGENEALAPLGKSRAEKVVVPDPV